MQKTKIALIVLIESVQNTIFGIALASAIVYWKLSIFKDALGVSYAYFNMGLTMFMLAMFVLSGWQFVRASRKILDVIQKNKNETPPE